MPDLQPTSSFIPKRTANTPARRRRGSNFFVLSVVAYACLIAAPTASAAVYVYKIYTERQFALAVEQLDESMNEFSQANLTRVLEYDKRLKIAEDLVDSHISINKIFAILEKETADTVAFASFSLKRTSPNAVTVAADIATDGFDSAIFQRGQYMQSDNFADVALTNIEFTPATLEDQASIAMKAHFALDAGKIMYDPAVTTVTEVVTDVQTDDVAPETIVEEDEVIDGEEEVNQENL